MSESDGEEETVEGGMRVAMTAAARVAEGLARIRQQQLEQAVGEGEQQARALTERLRAEMTAAREAYAVVKDPHWWASAGVEEIARTYRIAAAWRDADPESAWVEHRMAEEVMDRHGVDVGTVETSIVGPHLEAAAAEIGRDIAVDVRAATTLLAGAERADRLAGDVDDPQEARGARHGTVSALLGEAEPGGDSADRR